LAFEAREFAALAAMPLKRKDPKDPAASWKRFCSAIGESIEEFKCPITNELPLDPVLAEDGKVYERSAIETWLQNNQRSPSTNEAMGESLIPATQIKNIIQRMVNSDALPKDKAEACKKRPAEQEDNVETCKKRLAKEEDEVKACKKRLADCKKRLADCKKRLAKQEAVAELRTKAEGGDAQAAYELGNCFECGTNNLCKDHAKAFAMYQQSSKGGNAKAMACLASYYYFDYGVDGVETNYALALRWAAAGVALGNGRAMMTLGDMYAKGMAGLPKDEEEGIKLLVRGAELGNANAKGLYQVAQMFAKGNGTSVDMDKAAYWMRKAVAHNNPKDYGQKARDWLRENGYHSEDIHPGE